MAEKHGAGPFFLVENIDLAWGFHRGKERKFIHTSAFGQWGNVMLELVQQDSEGPSPFRDMYGPGEEGIHHMAMIVDSLLDTYTWCEEHGYEIATKAQTLGGNEFAFVDTTATLGHMLEIYERTEQLLGFYDLVLDASTDWRGEDPVRRFR